MTSLSSRIHNDDIIYPSALAFVLVHLACLAVFWTGFRGTDVVVCLGLYLLRMFAITAGLHRYFSHKTFKTSRVFQFLLAAVAATSAQKGAIWWAAKHREHHKYSDTPDDVHSPGQSGFFVAHVGWIFSKTKGKADLDMVKDLTRCPELVWLNRHDWLPAILLAFAVLLTLGWSGLVVGFFVSTVLVYHCTFAINSLAHIYGKQRYITGDDSRNNWLLALITLGEGWHNNHHYYQASTRQGFRWWEIDVTFYLLKLLSLVGVVWDLRSPPRAVVQGEKRLRSPVIEKVAYELARGFSVEAITTEIRSKWEQMPDLGALREPRRLARARVEAYLADWNVPELPSVEELRERALEKYAQSPSLDEIARRARQILVEALCDELPLQEVPAE
jgi:stearoyl-CoA desaturase (delta-9 desaturase)